MKKTAETVDKDSWLPPPPGWYNTLPFVAVISMWIYERPFLGNGTKYSVLNLTDYEMDQILCKFCLWSLNGNENVKTAKCVSWLKSIGSLKSMDPWKARWHNSQRNFRCHRKTFWSERKARLFSILLSIFVWNILLDSFFEKHRARFAKLVQCK